MFFYLSSKSTKISMKNFLKSKIHKGKENGRGQVTRGKNVTQFWKLGSRDRKGNSFISRVWKKKNLPTEEQLEIYCSFILSISHNEMIFSSQILAGDKRMYVGMDYGWVWMCMCTKHEKVLCPVLRLPSKIGGWTLEPLYLNYIND